MRLNTATKPDRFTHEGAPAKHIDHAAQLRRLAMSCLLWERQFYVDGREIADQLGEAVDAALAQGDKATVIGTAIEAREQSNLRHLPLYLAALYASRVSGDAQTKHLIERVVQRADELAEFLALYCEVTGMSPKAMAKLPGQVKKGLALAFAKFDAYQIAKYDRANAITLLDVARLVHPKHTDAIGALVGGDLTAPDTWEVALSGGADKREAFTRLLSEGKLGYMAVLRNLRNMHEAGVDSGLVKEAIRARKGARRVLPFRYVAAARYAPWAVDALNDALLAALAEKERFDGKTLILVDVSGSMGAQLSQRSDMTRMDAAAALASLWRGEHRVFSFSQALVECPAYDGLPGIDAIARSQPSGGTYLGAAMREMNAIEADRLVVITDEQSHDRVPDPVHRHAYLINVASYQNGVGYGRWTHIDGWSDSVFRFMHAHERG